MNGSATASGSWPGAVRVEHPDTGLERQERPLAFGVGLRGKRPLPEKVSAGEAEDRFDAHVGGRSRCAGRAHDLAGETVERLRGDRRRRGDRG